MSARAGATVNVSLRLDTPATDFLARRDGRELFFLDAEMRLAVAWWRPIEGD